MECLNNIIGISNTDCECFSEQISRKDRVSTSGVYLDEVEGGLRIDAIEKVSCKDFVDAARKARKRAIDAFGESILAQYVTEGGFAQRYQPFDGRIGKVEHVRTLSVSRWAGLRLRTRLIRGSSIKVSAVGLILSREGEVTVYIYKGYSDSDEMELLHTIEAIPVLANMRSIRKLDEVIELPLWDERNRPIDYYMVYDADLNGYPRDNKATCSCGGAERTLKTYMSIGGISSAIIDDIPHTPASVNANGVYLEAKIDCTSKESVCNLLKLDESKSIAHAIAYKAQEFLIEELMGSGNINRFTMLSKGHLWGKRNHFRKEFDNRIVWLTQAYPYDKINDCVHCNDNRMYKGLIR